MNAEARPVEPLRPAYVQATNPGHVSHLVARCFGGPSQPGLHLSPGLPVAEIVARLNDFAPTHLVGYPSGLHVLADESVAGRLRIPVQRVQSQAEPLLPQTRAALSLGFGVPVTELYGASECLNIGVGWPGEDWLRFSEDNAVVEPVLADGVTPAPVGEPSARLDLTNVINRVLPLIRYRLDDEITVLGEDDSGRPGRPFRVGGRCDDAFRWGDIVVHPHPLRSALGRPGVSEYQVRQTERGVAVSVRAEPGVDLAAIAADLEQAMVAAGLPRAVARVEQVDTIQRHPQTGKLARFVRLPN